MICQNKLFIKLGKFVYINYETITNLFPKDGVGYYYFKGKNGRIVAPRYLLTLCLCIFFVLSRVVTLLLFFHFFCLLSYTTNFLIVKYIKKIKQPMLGSLVQMCTVAYYCLTDSIFLLQLIQFNMLKYTEEEIGLPGGSSMSIFGLPCRA